MVQMMRDGTMLSHSTTGFIFRRLHCRAGAILPPLGTHPEVVEGAGGAAGCKVSMWPLWINRNSQPLSVTNMARSKQNTINKASNTLMCLKDGICLKILGSQCE